jgi:2-(1,2-epoxy-1,2-dihydrophenyl)acetyl-CoA isomerase
MSSSSLLVAQTGAVRTLTLNRPEALNSFNGELLGCLLAALNDAAQDASVRCVVLAASGRAFCAGQDLTDPSVAPVEGESKDLGEVIARHYAPLVMRLRSLPVPTVAMVQGVAAGAGANLALNCDLVVAGRAASFIQAFGKVGLLPDTGGTWLLPRLLGRAKALGLMFLGERLKADEAERLGLIWRCVDDAELSDAVSQLAANLAAMPMKALVATREAVDKAHALSMAETLELEVQMQRQLGHSADYTEGVRAFGAKRAPVFTDR